MKITLSGYDFNRIMRTCRPAIDKTGLRDVLSCIEFRCKDGRGVASACDGFAMAQCCFSYEGDDGVFLLRSHRTVSNDTDVSIMISANGKKISVSDGTEIITRDNVVAEYINLGNVVAEHETKEKRATFTINAARLRKILNSFSGINDAVLFEIRGDLDAVIMRNVDTYALLLPVRCNERRNVARFERPVFDEANEAGEEGGTP